MIRVALAALVGLVAGATPAPAEPVPTEVVVRVISQDAKFVGDLTGGASIRLVDAATGTVLAQGKTTGSTGDTPAIMEAKGRTPARSTGGSAAFRATLKIDRPMLIRVEAAGPLGYPETMQRATSERWLIPGAAMAGSDGWVIELPGLAITLDGAPPRWRAGTAGPLVAHVQLMCGCPITPGGMWAAEEYAVSATIAQGGSSVLLPLTFATAPGRYAARWTPAKKGAAELTISAANRRTGNAGVLTKTVIVE